MLNGEGWQRLFQPGGGGCEVHPVAGIYRQRLTSLSAAVMPRKE
jgi:hypothetical protein